MTEPLTTETAAIDGIEDGTLHLTNVEVVSSGFNRQQVRGFANGTLVVDIRAANADIAVNIADRLARNAGLTNWGNR